jgi:cyclopropane fatty-acyl-phospholipid synthase-like methyltransferase
MNTKGFNFLDILVAKWRLGRVENKINKGDKVLDFGCGTQGYLIRDIRQKISYGLGLDADVENSVEGNLEFKKLRYRGKLDLGNKKFNKIVMLAVLEHIEPQKVNNLIAEFGRILENRGQIIMTTPTKLAKPLLVTLARLGVLSKEEIFDHKKYWDWSDINALAKSTGFTVVSYKLFQWGLNSEITMEKI